MAFDRVLNVYVGKDLKAPVVQSPGVVVDGSSDNLLQIAGRLADGSPGLDCTMRVNRSNRMRKNTASVTVYNLNPEVRRWLDQDHMLIRIDAGYKDDGFGPIFYGAFGHAQSSLVGGDWETVIEAYHFRSLSMAFETLFVAVSYEPGALLGDVLQDIQQMLGVIVVGIDAVKNIPLDGGRVVSGVMRNLLKEVEGILRAHGYGMFYDLAELVIYPAGTGIATLDQTYISLDSGLLSAEYDRDEVKETRLEVRSANRLSKANARVAKAKSADGTLRADQMKKIAQYQYEDARRTRVKFRALPIHTIRPNAFVNIFHTAVKGTFSVDDIEYSLSNFGDEFHMDVKASTDLAETT